MFKYECEHFQVCTNRVEIVEMKMFLVQSELNILRLQSS